MGFLREGWRELGRKLERNRLRSQLRRQEAERQAALARLGQRAWQEKIDLSAFPELREQLASLEERAGALSASSQSLEAERTTLEERRRAEASRFESERRAVEEKKRPVDAALRAARENQSQQERTLQQLDARSARLATELAAVEKQITTLTGGATPQQQTQLAAAQTRRQQLLSEQAQLPAQRAAAKEALPPLVAEVSRLSEESQRYGAELSRVESERKAALGQLDAELSRVRGQLGTTARETGAVEKERTERFAQLGAGLYDRKVADPALAESIQQIVGFDRDRTGTQAALEASLAQTRALPSGTLLKFAATLVLVPLFLVVLAGGAYWGWTWWQERQPVEEVEVNPYLSHPLSEHPAYLLANRLAEAENKEEAAQYLLGAFRAIGLGVYTGEGKQVLGGAERSEKDFFLYDFQWKILARAFHHRNVISFADYSRGLGAGLVELDDPAQMTPFFAEAVGRRYQAAVQTPYDPTSFLILFVDGLARRQLQPYSLDELKSRPAEHLYLDPAQTFLLLLEFFLRPPAAAPATSRWPVAWPGLASVHAASPCDLIQGDAQGYWGRGTDVATEIVGLEAEGQKIFGAAGKVAGAIGDVTGVIGAAGDLLTLYGIDIHVKPEPYVIHLQHEDEEIAWITTTVTFDAEIVSDEVLKCGWLAGKKMPVKGPLKDVELRWDFEPDLPPHLEMAREMTDRLTGHVELKTKTNVAGVSSFLIQPKNCPDRKGRIVGQDYMAVVTARVVTADIPTPGGLGVGLIWKLGPGALEYLMGGRTGYARFRAEWHKKEEQYSEEQ